MIITLSGVTGVGKSFFKKQMIDRFNFKNLNVVTTREKRDGEIEGVDKYFLTDAEYEKKALSKEISVTFEFTGSKYAYYTKDLLSSENSITELHYTTIEDFKKVAKNVFSIYLVPSDVQIAKEQLIKRNLQPNIEKQRLEEIDEQIKKIKSDDNIKNQFDCIIENDYTSCSIDNLIKIIKSKMEGVL